MELLVVGAGEMGRWLADTVDASVAFADLDSAVAVDAAAGRPTCRTVETDTDEQFDAVCLSVPMSAVVPAIEQYAENATGAIFDISGVMAAPLSAMETHAPSIERASYHPLFAPPRIPGNIAAVTADSGPILEAIESDLKTAGNTVFSTTAEEHDRAMETVQSAAHTAILAYALAAEDVRPEFATPVSARLDDLVSTVTEGSPDVYAEIQDAFDGADRVAATAQAISDADRAAFTELYRKAGTDTETRTRHD
ncbi:prephenate dehydrogenase/arogenate dehydrogenase family protein [Natronocalculus amylovorans]|uniref:Prephenate dehydrogenase/arogenate dehydrogenase family protein n=1 Tax=Natronocalculus amylovorans TaxID=2917812 RepID=A0AAE3K8L9_9EURY|nr:prephenate dehydrogenase/arogenate dehydrogenase family protein [Natronocalculus amylovorans]MCL9817166.1 prephenate dehydrogenase/arogenate dehydrogenase family protein [Natronocalculus amylovorans]